MHPVKVIEVPYLLVVLGNGWEAKTVRQSLFETERKKTTPGADNQRRT